MAKGMLPKLRNSAALAIAISRYLGKVLWQDFAVTISEVWGTHKISLNVAMTNISNSTLARLVLYIQYLLYKESMVARWL